MEVEIIKKEKEEEFEPLVICSHAGYLGCDVKCDHSKHHKPFQGEWSAFKICTKSGYCEEVDKVIQCSIVKNELLTKKQK